MSNFSQLSDEEYCKICSVIPHKFIIGYFQKNPKEFSKLQPGFRAVTLQNKDAVKLLVTYRDRAFISSFVERIANDWIKEIQSFISRYQSNGETDITSHIHALYQSFFSNNISAFFKLINKELNSEQMEMITNIVALLKNTEEKQCEAAIQLTELKNKLTENERETVRNKKLIEKNNNQLKELTATINTLKTIEAKYYELAPVLEEKITENENKAKQICSLERQISQLNETINTLQKEKKELDNSIRESIKKENEIHLTLLTDSHALSPVDMEEFKDFFSFNLESIDVRSTVNKILTEYVADILFEGKPIICNKRYVDTFARCVSNSLTGNAPINIITYSSKYDEKAIATALNNCGRIVILDNFLGNYNETVLLSIIEHFASKIIFLSVTYERTLFYLPEEFLAYCCYINLSHIANFACGLGPSEDPSLLEEINSASRTIQSNKYQKNITTITSELGFSPNISQMIIEHVKDDLSACAMLLFNILPYVKEVRGKEAFNISESLQRYVSHNPFRAIFEEWFML